MLKYLIPMIFVLFVLTGCPGGGNSKSSNGGGAKATSGETPPKTAQAPPAKTTPAIDPLKRGKEIYFGSDYSNTSLTCAHCHAASPELSSSKTYIAHSGHGAFKRGAWKISKQEQLDAGQGYAEDLIDAANVCVKAPYMNHKEELITGDDAAALEAYLESIATDDAPFIIARTKEMPIAGLTADKANGQMIYELSCKICHDSGVEDVPELVSASEWLNPLQVMAKVRKIGDYYNDWEGKTYAVAHNGKWLAVLGVATAHAQENPCGDNPCGENPCGENPCGDGHEDHDHDDDHGMFKENAMPFYGTDILSDQEVVDVAYYVAEEL